MQGDEDSESSVSVDEPFESLEEFLESVFEMLPDYVLIARKYSSTVQQITESIAMAYSERLESFNSQLIHRSDQTVR